MSDDNLVYINKHKKALERIRNEYRRDELEGSGGTSSAYLSRDDEPAYAATERDDRSLERDDRQTRGTLKTVSGSNRADGTVRLGTGPIDGQSLDTAESTDPAGRRDEADQASVGLVRPELTPEQKKERERELDRQRKARKRAESSEKRTPEPEGRIGIDTGAVPHIPTITKPEQKKSEPEPVKLFTNVEADNALDRLTKLYTGLSGLPDDVLEIIVKDHEPVQIWQLDEDEARAMAEMQLSRAKTDKDAARQVRILLAVYERLYMLFLVKPRLIATAQHIHAHGGLSFK